MLDATRKHAFRSVLVTSFLTVYRGEVGFEALAGNLRKPPYGSPVDCGLVAHHGGGLVPGHLYCRDETWTYVVDTGRDASGRRRQKAKGGFRTKKDARLALNSAMHALQEGVYVEPSKLTVADFLRNTWLPAAKGTLRPTTFSSYEMHVRCYLSPAFGHLRLQQVTPAAINAFYGSLRGGWGGRQALSPASIRRVHATLHRALRDAVRWQLLARNAAGGADPPKAPLRPKQVSRWFTAASRRAGVATCTRHWPSPRECPPGSWRTAWATARRR